MQKIKQQKSFAFEIPNSPAPSTKRKGNQKERKKDSKQVGLNVHADRNVLAKSQLHSVSTALTPSSATVIDTMQSPFLTPPSSGEGRSESLQIPEIHDSFSDNVLHKQPKYYSTPHPVKKLGREVRLSPTLKLVIPSQPVDGSLPSVCIRAQHRSLNEILGSPSPNSEPPPLPDDQPPTDLSPLKLTFVPVTPGGIAESTDGEGSFLYQTKSRNKCLQSQVNAHCRVHIESLKDATTKAPHTKFPSFNQNKIAIPKGHQYGCKLEVPHSDKYFGVKSSSSHNGTFSRFPRCSVCVGTMHSTLKGSNHWPRLHSLSAWDVTQSPKSFLLQSLPPPPDCTPPTPCNSSYVRPVCNSTVVEQETQTSNISQQDFQLPYCDDKHKTRHPMLFTKVAYIDIGYV